jgi:hypothetical protein
MKPLYSPALLKQTHFKFSVPSHPLLAQQGSLLHPLKFIVRLLPGKCSGPVNVVAVLRPLYDGSVYK